MAATQERQEIMPDNAGRKRPLGLWALGKGRGYFELGTGHFTSNLPRWPLYQVPTIYSYERGTR